MPREAARLFLAVKNVRLERLQDISSDDACNEGVECCKDCMEHGGCNLPGVCAYSKQEFKELWNSINAKRGYGWDTNPWVWVIEFERR